MQITHGLAMYIKFTMYISTRHKCYSVYCSSNSSGGRLVRTTSSLVDVVILILSVVVVAVNVATVGTRICATACS